MNFMKDITTFSKLVNFAKESHTDIWATWSVVCSDAQSERMGELMKNNKEVHFFECEGEMFRGERKFVFIQFMLDEPTGADFYVWCQKNLTRYTPAS